LLNVVKTTGSLRGYCAALPPRKLLLYARHWARFFRKGGRRKARQSEGERAPHARGGGSVREDPPSGQVRSGASARPRCMYRRLYRRLRGITSLASDRASHRGMASETCRNKVAVPQPVQRLKHAGIRLLSCSQCNARGSTPPWAPSPRPQPAARRRCRHRRRCPGAAAPAAPAPSPPRRGRRARTRPPRSA